MQFDAQVGGQQFRLTCPHNLGPDRIVEADIPDAPQHGPPPGLPHTSSQQMMVTVPHGTWPGQMMQVDTPHGRVQVQAPGPPGTQFMIEVPTGGAPPPPDQAEREMAERFRQVEEQRQREIREREAAQQRRMEARSTPNGLAIQRDLERRQAEERQRRQQVRANGS